MIKSVLKAKSGSWYLKIQVPGQPTIIIFDTQEWIFDFIYDRLNIVTYEGYNADINYLAEKCTNETYYIYLKAFTIKEQLYDFWASFHEDSEYDGDYGDFGKYDPQWYSMSFFDEENN